MLAIRGEYRQLSRQFANCITAAPYVVAAAPARHEYVANTVILPMRERAADRIVHSDNASKPRAKGNPRMYQIDQLTQNLGRLTNRMPKLPATSRQHTSQLRVALAKLTQLATLRVIPGRSFDATERHDPRDPRNW